MTADFEYHTHDPLFVTLYANTPQASVELSRFMSANEGSNKIFALHFPAIKKCLKSAGYTIRKGKKVTQSIDSIIAELGGLDELYAEYGV